MFCVKCKQDVPIGANFCPRCGREVSPAKYDEAENPVPPKSTSNITQSIEQKIFCRNCGRQITEDASVCPYCRQQLIPAPEPPIETHLAEAILVTIFCCMPLGVVSLIYAAQVSSLANSGNITAARQASQNAHKWAMVSLWIGLSFVMIFIVLQVFPFILALIAGIVL